MADMGTGKSHRLLITDRRILSVGGVSKVQSFGPKEIVLETNLGNLNLRGEDLGIKHLDLQEGVIEVEGQVDAVVYMQASASRSRTAWWRRIFR